MQKVLRKFGRDRQGGLGTRGGETCARRRRGEKAVWCGPRPAGGCGDAGGRAGRFCADRGLRAAAGTQAERRVLLCGPRLAGGRTSTVGTARAFCSGRRRPASAARGGGAEKIRKKCGDFITKRAIAQDFCAKELTKDLPTCYNSSRDCGRIFLRAPFCCEFFCFSDSRARVRRDPATCFLNCVRAI